MIMSLPTKETRYLYGILKIRKKALRLCSFTSMTGGTLMAARMKNLFWKAFAKMPWLTLPYEDTYCNKKLQRIFDYPQELVGTKPDSTLVIIGRNGKFVEPLGANILLEYGALAYPFTVFNPADLELEKVSKVKPGMFWDLDAVFRHRNGSQVRFSQLVGKRIIVLFQSRMSKLERTPRELESR
ncbi:putative nucleoredoxin 3 isoform X2 [Apium graveolens]|uniref:putative nucleoredoxin 3 isoform X2 n=1 Tax=Apium graveolens TaxID=4045 RepID=UPI003D7BEC4E